MYYNLSDELQAQSLLTKVRHDIGCKKVVEYKEKQTERTMRQNAYAHVAISYFALQIGESVEYCKRRYFKYTCNPDIFVREKTDKVTGERVLELRSFRELTKDETSLAIERFLKWSSEVAGIYIPSPEDTAQVRRMEMEVENNRRYL